MTVALAIFMLGLLFMAVALMVMAYVFKRRALAFGGAMGWVLVGVYAYTLSVAAWDIFYGLFWFAMGLVVLSVLETLALREKEEEQQEEEKDSIDRYLERHKKQMDKFRKWRELEESTSKRKGED